MKASITKKMGFLFLITMALFLVLGNFPRILPFSSLMGSVNVSELVLYILTLCCACVVARRLMVCQLFLILSGGVIFSLCVGLLKWGMDSIAVIYNVRLILQITAAAVAGIFLHEHYGDHPKPLVKAYMRLYLLIVLFSYIIFVVFPDMALLLSDLDGIGIVFRGDPHAHRLVSPYLDPNFFGIIIVLPIILAIYTFYHQPSFFNGLCNLFYLGALFLTVSRSGLSLFFLFSAVLVLIGMSKLATSPHPGRLLPHGRGAFVVIGTVLALMIPLWERSVGRFTKISSDLSALARLDSFYVGTALFNKEPMMGFGYNYSLKSIAAARGVPGLDSSLQGLVVNFGLLPMLALTLTVLRWSARVHFTLKSYDRTTGVYTVWRLVMIYVILSILWAANFNPVLLYPFWLVPVLSMLMYFECVAHKKQTGMQAEA